jgi:cytochrome c oxidase subunit 2
LGGKVDAIPGKANRIVLTADAPGAYAGQCAEFCGDLHAHMGFIAYAHGPAQLEAALRAAATAP